MSNTLYTQYISYDGRRFSSAAALRFEVMRIVLPRTRYWEGPEERAYGTRSHKSTKNEDEVPRRDERNDRWSRQMSGAYRRD